jgi:hypothetical protein
MAYIFEIRCVKLTTYHHILPMSRNLGALTLLDPSGPAWPILGVLYLLLYVFEMLVETDFVLVKVQLMT